MAMKLRPAALLLVACASPAAAELPEPVRAMIEAAVATGDPAKVATVVDLARQTNPDDAAEIDALHDRFKARQRELAAAEKARREEEIRTAGVFENWSGRGQVGAFLSTGNSETSGVTFSLALERTGIDWQHRLRGTMDYQRSNGRTSREQYLAAWEPRYQVGKALFAYGLAQYESDRLQGDSARYAVSGGIGYKVIDEANAQLSLKAGPAWRLTEFVNGTDDSSFGGLAGIDFDWQLAKALKLTQDANLVADAGGQAAALVTSNNVSALLTTGLEAQVSSKVSTRLSYSIDYDSNPPPGTVSTDTMTRFTLVYGF